MVNGMCAGMTGRGPCQRIGVYSLTLAGDPRRWLACATHIGMVLKRVVKLYGPVEVSDDPQPRPVCPTCRGCYADGPCVCSSDCDRHAQSSWPFRGPDTRERAL